MTAGAYGAVQAGTYNTRPLIPEVMVRGGDSPLSGRASTLTPIIALDRLPDWLEK